MKKRNKKHENRIKKLIVGCVLCAVVLTVSTYAWFIGMKTVDVSSFDVEIAAIDGLSLSLDGEKWSDTVSINKSNYTLVGTSYANNTNSWGGKDGGIGGLVPMSTVGKINADHSRLILYEKGSLTTTHGGYRIMASEVLNKGAKEERGYVVFDLFVKNLSGNKYYPEYDQNNEEAIYLATDSIVEVKNGGVQNTGIENSVRVAFAQIGRVKSNASVSEITGITCDKDDTSEAVTGICERTATIWEPNDTKHVDNAINWYKTSCAKRTGSGLTEDDYDDVFGTCNEIVNGVSYDTYAISTVVDQNDKIDVYDGEDYNGYKGTTYDATTNPTGKLQAFDYFTDSEKNLEGVKRPTFMTLAPNSVTKVRVYIYIEGQDVDNYDFASLGKQISVAFGFTKERFFDEDVKYSDKDTATLPDDVIKKNHYKPITTISDEVES